MVEVRPPLMFRLKGTVILSIWWQIILMCVYTAAVVYIHLHVDGFRMNFPQTLIPVLGVVTGLLLVFRTNTAYDR
jgi:putative membrane protein